MILQRNRVMIAFCLASLALGVVGYRTAQAANCLSGAKPCSYDMGGGSCCFTVSSIPTASPWNGGSGRPQWRVTGATCGIQFVRYLGSDCGLITAYYCGDAVDQSCY